MTSTPFPEERRPLSAVVLAAGEGTRMRSDRPKPLHRLCGRPMVLHVLDALGELRLDRAVVVVGHGAERVTKALADDSPRAIEAAAFEAAAFEAAAFEAPAFELEFVEQVVQRGTGDAVSVALTAFPDEDLDDAGDIVVLPGDTPLLRPATLAALIRHHRASDAAATVLTARLANPTGYGRVVRSRDGRVARIVEEADATDEERLVDEINTSIYAFRRSVLAPALRRLSPDNSQGEYYLTDTIAVLHSAGYAVTSLMVDDPMEAAGVNDRAQLAVAEAELRDRINERWMRRGVTMLDPEHTYLDATVELGRDVTLFPGVILQGRTLVGAGAEIGPGCQLIDSTVGERSRLSFTVARYATVGHDATVGPWATLPPGSRVPDGAVTGACFTGGTDDAEESG